MKLNLTNSQTTYCVKEYVVVNQKELAEFFVNEAAHADYQFFHPVIKETNEIRNKFGI